MNYLEIINKTLLELNYAPVADFGELTKMEHKKLMNIINRLNKEICNQNDEFYFRQVMKKIVLHPQKVDYNIELNGKILKVRGKNSEYYFEPDYMNFYGKNIPAFAYSFFGQKLLFSPSSDEVTVFYSTNNFVISKNDELKADFETGMDKSILPDMFAEKLLVNGGAYLFKQNSSHPKYIHWKQEYEKTLKELISDAKRVSPSDIIIDGGYRKL